MPNIWYVSKAIHNFDFSFFVFSSSFFRSFRIRFLSVPYSKFLFIWLLHGRYVQLTSFANLAHCSLVGALKYSRYVPPKRKHESRREREKKTFELTFGVHVPQVCTIPMAVDSSVSSGNQSSSSSKFLNECLSCVCTQWVSLLSGYTLRCMYFSVCKP